MANYSNKHDIDDRCHIGCPRVASSDIARSSHSLEALTTPQATLPAFPQVTCSQLLWRLLTLVTLTFCFLPSVQAHVASLNWDASPSISASGYKIYVGTSSGNYTLQIDTAANLTYDVDHLEPNSTYYFTVTAYNSDGEESTFSNEISLYVPSDDSTTTSTTIPTTTIIPTVPTSTTIASTTPTTPITPSVPTSTSIAATTSTIIESETSSTPTTVATTTIGTTTSSIIALPATSSVTTSVTTSQLPAQVDNDGGNNSSNDKDSDNDGLTDKQEMAIGTNPKMADSDQDGISDKDELRQNTNPMDSGSIPTQLDSNGCAEWSNDLRISDYSEQNILEQINTQSRTISVTASIYDNQGKTIGRQKLDIKPFSQLDLPLSSFKSYRKTPLGRICLSHNGATGALQARLLYYNSTNLARATTARTTNGADYNIAVASSLSSGKRGMVKLPYNTYQPCPAPASASEAVENWLQIANLSDKVQKGQVKYYNMDGKLTSSTTLKVPAKGRLDIPVHSLGASRAGHLEWNPQSKNIPFHTQLTRYYRQCPGTEAPAKQYSERALSSAAAFTGKSGTGQPITVPYSLDTSNSVLELSNALNETVIVYLQVVEASGKISVLKATLSPRKSSHILLNKVSKSKQGFVTVRANKKNGIIANLVTYAYVETTKGAYTLNHIYSTAPEEAISSLVRGSYNALLEPNCQLIILNPTGKKDSLTIDIYNTKNKKRLTRAKPITISKGRIDIPLNSTSKVNTYKQIHIRTKNKTPILAWIVRVNKGNYTIPTSLY